MVGIQVIAELGFGGEPELAFGALPCGHDDLPLQVYACPARRGKSAVNIGVPYWLGTVDTIRYRTASSTEMGEAHLA